MSVGRYVYVGGEEARERANSPWGKLLLYVQRGLGSYL